MHEARSRMRDLDWYILHSRCAIVFIMRYIKTACRPAKEQVVRIQLSGYGAAKAVLRLMIDEVEELCRQKGLRPIFASDEARERELDAGFKEADLIEVLEAIGHAD